MLSNFFTNRAFPSLTWTRAVFLLAAATMIFWACQLTQSNSNRYALSFSKLYDSLSKYDSVVIEVRDSVDEGITDTVFHAKVSAKSDLENLGAPHYHGGGAVIIITGFKAGKIALQLDKRFNGTTGKTLVTDSMILPNIVLSRDSTSLHLKAGDTTDLPKVTVAPDGLADKSLIWETSNAAVLAVSG